MSVGAEGGDLLAEGGDLSASNKALLGDFAGEVLVSEPFLLGVGLADEEEVC